MAPDRRRRLIAFCFVSFPLGAWLGTAMYLTGAAPRQVHWRLLSAWIRATPHHPLLLAAIAAGFVLTLVVALSLRRWAKSEGYDGAGYIKHIRGTEIVPFKVLAKRCKEWFKDQVDVAGIRMPTAIEVLHLLGVGATGTGKSVFLRALLFSIRKRGDRAVIIDPDGDLYRKFGLPGDIILNPYDQRTEGWSFFNEIRAEYDWKRLALSLVPQGKTNDQEEWNEYGRLLLRETARKLYELGTPSVQELFRWCTIANDKDLRLFLSGTLAESLFAGSAEASKALTSARFVISKYITEHMSMPSGTFSIREWMNNGTGCLFIPWREDMMLAQKPLVSAFVDVCLSEVLSWPELGWRERARRRWWLLIDELASLEKLSSLLDGLTKGRKRGLRIVAFLQVGAQLVAIYGKELADTLRGNFRSLVVFGGSRTDPETAEEMSTALGEHEVVRVEYTDSRSVGSSRNTTERLERKTERVVTKETIQSLPDLTGYVAFAGDRPIAKFKLEPVTFLDRNPAFVEAKRTGAYAVTSKGRGIDVTGPTPWDLADLPDDPTQGLPSATA